MDFFATDLPYEEGLRLQEAAVEIVQNQAGKVCLLGFEHRPVVSMGLRARSEDLLERESFEANGFSVVHVKRGGQATLHMPGQLVIYPVLNLREYGFGVKEWIHFLAEVTVKTLKDLNIDAFWNAECPGIYTARGKIAAIGIRVHRGISQHGLCLNVNNALEPFSWLIPCGMQNMAQDRLVDWGYTNGVLPLNLLWKKKFTGLLTRP